MTGTIQTPHPHLVVASVGYEEDSSICAATASGFRALLTDIDEDLPTSAGPDAFLASPGGFAAWLRAQADQRSRQARWTAVRDRFTPFLIRRNDDIRLPECVLILPARRLIDDSDRQALVADLVGARDMFACFLLVFLDEGGIAPPLQDGDAASSWLASFASLLPDRVAVYLLSTTAPSGEPVAASDLSRLAAIALAADLVLPHENSERILSYRPGSPIITLGTFGGRALEFNHAVLADRLQPRLVKELLTKTVLHEVTSPPGTPMVPATAPELMLNATPRHGEHEVTLHIAGRADGAFAGQPAVVGPDFRATPSFGGLARQLHLDQVPRRDWMAQLHEWDVLLRDGILPPLLRSASSSLATQQREQLAQVREYLAATLATTGGAALAQPACDAVAQRVTEQYDVRVARESAPSLGQTLEEVQRGLARIPHLPSLILRTAMLSAVPAFILALALLDGSDSTWRATVQWILLLLVLAAPVLATMARFRGLAAAADARDRALEHAERRCQLRYANTAAAGVLSLRAFLLHELGGAAVRLSEMVEGLRRMGEGTSRAASRAAGRLVRTLPEQRDDERFYETLFGSRADSRLDVLAPRFTECIQSEAVKVLEGAALPHSVIDAVGHFVGKELERDLRTRFRLWRLLRNDEQAESETLDPDAVREHVASLVRGGALVCWQGRAVEHALLNPHVVLRAFVAPRVLLPVTPDESLVELINEVRDVIAVLWRVELTALDQASAGQPPQTSSAQAEGGPE